MTARLVGYRETVPGDVSDAERDDLRGPLADVVRLLTDGMSIDVMPRLLASSSNISSDNVHVRNINRLLLDLDLTSLVILKEPHAMHTAEATPVKTRRPPMQLVVLVLIWLILIGGPVAEGKLPDGVQVMLSTEIGTVSLALAITQMMNRK